MMRWRKLPYNEKANTHRRGWVFVDLLDSNDELLCTVRYAPGLYKDYPHLENLHDYSVIAADRGDDQAFLFKTFATLKEAQAQAVAYYIKKRLDEV